MAHVLTHHTNIRNPQTKKVRTFEPGEELPRWAHDILAAENHVAYRPDDDEEARMLVRRWQASKAAAAVMNQEG